ncbi:MAG TPA: CbiX/SirB N-terminal domain-containing protein [Burkholderiaceae bacterium]|nr:CbiX/SirB N-terminal domain-containing protein [Burkholderiaceae bacterium]
MKRGLLLIAHGARDARWAQPFEDVARRVRAAAPELSVQLAFLELMQPDLRAAGAQLAGAGCTQIDVLPLFLGAGGHVRNDLPRWVNELRLAHGQVRWNLCSAVGELDTVIEAMAQAALALVQAPTVSPAPHDE